jgi:hypothetical protein
VRQPPDLEPVPTIKELAKQRLAIDASGGHGSHYRVTPEGQQMIYDAMARNAERGRAWEATRRKELADERARTGE